MRTIVVSPVPGNPGASGAALENAVAQTSASSASDPWLIKLEPGLFEVGSTLQMGPYLHIEGSGEGVSVITKNGDSSTNGGTIRMADNSELRRLTVENRGAAAYAIAINAQGVVNVRLSHVTATASEGSPTTYAVMLDSASGAIEHSTVIGGGSNPAVGLIAAAGSSLTVRGTHVISNSTGVTNGQSDVRIVDCIIEAHGTTGNVLGVYVAGYGNIPTSNGSLIMNTLAVADGTGDAHGIEVAGGSFAELVSVRSTGTGSGLRMRTTGSQSGTTSVRAVGSVFEGPTGVVVLGGGYDTRLSGGQIRGGVAGSGLTCVFVSDQAFAALTSACTP